MLEVKVKEFVEKQRQLIDLEYEEQLSTQAEYLTKLTKQQLQRKGVALLNLRESSRSTGLAGKLVIEYTGGYENALPSHQIKVGDVVKVEKGSATKSTVDISVAFKDEYPEGWNDGLRIIKLANDVSFKRLRYALGKVEQLVKTGSHTDFLRLCFDPTFSPIIPKCTEDVKYYNDRLNDIQKKAVVKTLRLDPCALIHGPPGTGKTETLVEIVKQLAKPTMGNTKSKRILVCAPSNLAVDNLVERIGADKRFSLLRLGHPARMLDSAIQHSLDYKLVNGDSGKLVKEIRKEIDSFIAQLEKAKGQARREIYGNLKELRKELKQRESKSLSDIFQSVNIVLCTLNMAGSKQLNGQHFDVCIIDEASQALEAECWLPMIISDRVIFAGDHQQLPPTVTSEKAAAKGLADTIFGKLMKARPEIASILRIQYRMNEDIMKWASDAMYEGLLIADDSVAKHRLSDIVGGISIDDPIMMIDTAGMDMNEGVVDEGEVETKYNESEAKIALDHAKILIKDGLPTSDCAIITPYNGQVDLLKSMAETDKDLKGLEIGTVDSFQGREKEAIIISFVRSNLDGEIGFLKDVRRTNVAVTRARRHVCLIGDSDTLGRHPFYRALITYVEERGVIDYPA